MLTCLPCPPRKTFLLAGVVLAAGSLLAGAGPAGAAVKLAIDANHPWRPPFGLDRIGGPFEVVIMFAARPSGEHELVGYRDGKELSRRAVTLPGAKAPFVTRVSMDAGAAEVALLAKASPQAELAEVARQIVKLPAFEAEGEAEAVALPGSAVHPVDLGTVMVPNGWLLLAGGQKAAVEVAALSRLADVPGARVIAWYESAPADKWTVAMPLKHGEKAAAVLAVGAGARAEKKDILHVEIADAVSKQLWHKAIPVIRVPEAPKNPAFGAISTKLRYDPPIPTKYAPGKIDYDKGWDPNRNDVVVFFPNGARFVFWRGASYCPFWAGKYNTGFCYEWAEILSGHGIRGVNDCAEPLQDKELRYGRVEIVESSAARVHVRWSYQSCDLDYKVGGSYAVEDYYFYPDGFGTRVMTLTAHPGCKVETGEFIVFLPQSGYPFELLPEKHIDMLWPGGKVEVQFPQPPGGQPDVMAKLKTIGKDAQLMHRIRIDKYSSLAAISYSPWGSSHDLPGFPPFRQDGALVTPMYWGCHWPLSRGYPTGWAISDRISETPGHCSSMHAGTPRPLRTTTGEMPDAQGNVKTMQESTWVWLIGMTGASDEVLLQWAKSFAITPPGVAADGAKPEAELYAPQRRALRLTVEKPTVTIAIKPEGCCVNPVFELAAAPARLRAVSVDGAALDASKYAWDGKTLWLDVTLTRPAELRLEFDDVNR